MADQWASDKQRVADALSQLPATYGLRGYVGRVFRANAKDSYISGGEVLIYSEVEREDGTFQPFAKGTLAEVLAEIVALPSVAEVEELHEDQRSGDGLAGVGEQEREAMAPLAEPEPQECEECGCVDFTYGKCDDCHAPEPEDADAARGTSASEKRAAAKLNARFGT